MFVDLDVGEVGEDAVFPELVGEGVPGLTGPDEHGEERLVVDVDGDGDSDCRAVGWHVSLG